MKHCNTCGKPEGEISFGKNSSGITGFYLKCKQCRNKVSLKYRTENSETLRDKYHSTPKTEEFKQAVRDRSKKHYEENKDSYHKRNALWAKNNPDKIRGFTEKWAKANPDKAAKHSANRRAAKLQATPNWFREFDEFVMDIAYKTAKEREEVYGIPFHVDHIIPLQGETVCGFHRGLNVQVIPAYENLSKGNKLLVKYKG